uniref:Protegrin 1 n=1 Tax=Sus scrofa TaxID=9823 RepID=A0A4X1TP80_PIG
METQRASLCLGRWSLWLLLLGLVVPSASAQALSYREAVLRAVDRLNEQSSEANLYRLLELDQPPKADEDPGTPKPVSFTVKETVCPRPTRRPPELCDFKENGVRLGLGALADASQGAEQESLLGKMSRPWGEAGSSWMEEGGSQFDLESPLLAGETVCGDSHPGSDQGPARHHLQ